MKFVVRLFLTALALLLVTYLLPGIYVESLLVALIAAFFLGIVNAIIKPILIVLTLPITILTLGLFIFVINAALFIFVAAFVDGFTVSGFWNALFGSILVSIMSGIAYRLTK